MEERGYTCRFVDCINGVLLFFRKLEKRSNVLGQEVSLTENTPQRAQELLQAQQAQAVRINTK